MEMKTPPPMMTEKMPTTKPPTRSAAVSRVSSQGASALIHERSITVLHPDAMARAAADFLGIGKESSGDGTEGNLRLIRELVNSARRGSDYPDSRPANSDRASPVVPLLEGPRRRDRDGRSKHPRRPRETVEFPAGSIRAVSLPR